VNSKGCTCARFPWQLWNGSDLNWCVVCASRRGSCRSRRGLTDKIKVENTREPIGELCISALVERDPFAREPCPHRSDLKPGVLCLNRMRSERPWCHCPDGHLSVSSHLNHNPEQSNRREVYD